MRWVALATVLLMCCVTVITQANAQDSESSSADPADSSEDDLEQLRQLREALTEAIIAGDVEKQIQYVTPNVVTIWQNNQIAKGEDGLRDLLGNMGDGDDKIFQGYVERPSSDDVVILPGGTVAIAHGSSVPHYKWMGMEFDLENRWSATLVKSDDQWKLATYHVSGNLIDNPLLTAAKQSISWTAGIALLVGAIIGGLIGRRMSTTTESVPQ